MWLLFRVLLFSQRTTVHASERVKFLGHAGSRRFREDETGQSFGGDCGFFFPLLEQYSGGWIRQTGAGRGYRKDFERES